MLKILAMAAAALLLLLGIFLVATTPSPGNLHFSGISFIFVGIAVFVLVLMSWLNELYNQAAILAVGLSLAGVLFIAGLIFALVTFFF